MALFSWIRKWKRSAWNSNLRLGSSALCAAGGGKKCYITAAWSQLAYKARGLDKDENWWRLWSRGCGVTFAPTNTASRCHKAFIVPQTHNAYAFICCPSLRKPSCAIYLSALSDTDDDNGDFPLALSQPQKSKKIFPRRSSKWGQTHSFEWSYRAFARSFPLSLVPDFIAFLARV